MFWWKLWEMVVVTHRSASWSKKEWKWWRNEHNFFFSRCFKISWYHWIALDEIYSNLPSHPSLRLTTPVCLALISEFFLFLLVFPYWKKVVVGRIKFFHEISSLPENIGSGHPLWLTLKLNSKFYKGLLCLVCAPHPVLLIIQIGDHATVGSIAGSWTEGGAFGQLGIRSCQDLRVIILKKSSGRSNTAEVVSSYW